MASPPSSTPSPISRPTLHHGATPLSLGPARSRPLPVTTKSPPRRRPLPIPSAFLPSTPSPLRSLSMPTPGCRRHLRLTAASGSPVRTRSVSSTVCPTIKPSARTPSGSPTRARPPMTASSSRIRPAGAAMPSTTYTLSSTTSSMSRPMVARSECNGPTTTA